MFESLLNRTIQTIAKCRSTDKHDLAPRLWVLDMLCNKTICIINPGGLGVREEAV